MKDSSKSDITEILECFTKDTVTRKDVKLLLLELRDETEPASSIRDIANCIHSTRDQGNSVKLISRHVDNMVDIALNSGILSVEGIYKKEAIITELAELLNKLGFLSYTETIYTNAELIIQAISEFLDGTIINIKNNQIKSCTLKTITDKNEHILCFLFSLNARFQGTLDIRPNTEIAMPFFKD